MVNSKWSQLSPEFKYSIYHNWIYHLCFKSFQPFWEKILLLQNRSFCCFRMPFTFATQSTYFIISFQSKQCPAFSYIILNLTIPTYPKPYISLKLSDFKPIWKNWPSINICDIRLWYLHFYQVWGSSTYLKFGVICDILGYHRFSKRWFSAGYLNLSQLGVTLG